MGDAYRDLSEAGFEIVRGFVRPEGVNRALDLVDGLRDVVRRSRFLDAQRVQPLRRHLGDRLAIPFVLLTGYSTGDEFAVSPEADEVDAFLTKPVSAGMVDQLLRNLDI